MFLMSCMSVSCGTMVTIRDREFCHLGLATSRRPAYGCNLRS